ncbi:unnamed protein product [Symbiodinium sp. CCMP2456]|nr:unnamed protein product [Symbiodinium sp. CCMP2456]
MAAEPVVEPEPEGPLRVRRHRSALWPEDGALSKALEESGAVRAAFRTNRNHLLAWPSPELVGVASLKSMALNVAVLSVALEVWASTSPICKTMSVDWLKAEVTQVHKLLNPGISSKAVGIYVDAWGLKRLATLAMRRWKAPITTLRDRSLHVLFHIMTEAWGEYAPEADTGDMVAENDDYLDNGDDDAGAAAADDIPEDADAGAPMRALCDLEAAAPENAEALDSMAPEASDVPEVANAVAPEASDVPEVADAVAPEANDVPEVADAVAPEASDAATVSAALDDQLVSMQGQLEALQHLGSTLHRPCTLNPKILKLMFQS